MGCPLAFLATKDKKKTKKSSTNNSTPNNKSTKDNLTIVMNTVLDGLIIIDDMGTVQAFNPASVEIFGYQPEEVIGNNVKMLMPEPYHGEHDGYLSSYMKSGEAKVIGIGREVFGKRKDGSTFPMELGVNEMRLEGKRMFVGTVRDISERKKFEDELKAESGRVSAIMNTVLDGLITIDEIGTIQTFNPAAAKIFGYELEEVVGNNVRMLMPEPYHSEHDGYLSNYMKTGMAKVIGIGREVVGKRKDGSTFSMELGINEMHIEGKRMFVGTVRDISERKKFEYELRAESQRISAIMNTVLDGLITIDEIGTIQTFNLAAAKIFGYKLEEVVGNNVRMLMPEPYHSEHDHYLDSYIKSGDAKVIGIGREVFGRRKDGSTFPMELGVNEMHIESKRMFVGTVRDISERKRFEDELKAESERISAIMHTVLDGLITIDEVGTIRTFNPAAAKIFGYKLEEVVGNNVKMLMPEPYHSEHDDYLSNYMKSGDAKVIGIGREVFGRRKNGSKFPMELGVNEMHIEGKRMFVGTVRDISERKKFESELKAESQRISAIMNTVLDGLITIDEVGTLRTFNPAASKIFGYKSEEVVGNNVRMLMPEPYHSEHDHYLSSYMKSGEAKVIGIGREVFGRRKNGSTFPMELGVNEMHLEGKRMFVGTVRDISERKKFEDELKAESERISAIMNTVLDGLITIDEIGTIQTFNPAAAKIFGYELEEVVGNNVRMLMPEPYHSEHDDYLKNYIKTGDAKVIGIGREVFGRRKDGSTFPMELGVNEMHIEGKRMFVGTVRDIGERKKAEHDILAHLAELKRSNQELDDFAYIASHDLKEPLRGLSTNAMFLKEDYQEKLGGDAIKRLDRMGYLCERMEQLVNDLLYFSRLGRQDLAVQETDMNKVIKDIGSMMETTLQEENVAIKVPTKLPIITCDMPRITEVFRNLVTNAVKYNDKTEKIVEIGYVKMAIPASTNRKQGVFYVKDNGIGIPKKFYNDVFRIFKRLNAEDEAKKGTGVGLTFVKKIIERHGGQIWIESEVGTGTTFYFTINNKEEYNDTFANNIAN